ncbi:MAG: DNA repair protein RadA [Oscillospiraceae bacterium]
MANLRSIYVCNECGANTNKWFGKCPNCGEWNTLVEEIIERQPSSKTNGNAVRKKAALTSLCDVDMKNEIRYTTGIDELDRVLGGGIVKGSVVLIGGEPGAGKSTLLLQMCGNLSDTARVLYVSGEESVHQLKLRADRLEINAKNIMIANETDVECVASTIVEMKPDLAVIDSIQTMNYEAVTSSAGSVAQVRECTSLLTRTAKSEEIPIFIVGHVNKDGAIAGPKVMEHIVDTVLYFEGDKYLSYRILRSAKNRYGSTNEIGLFDMTSRGLSGVSNPSSMLLDGRDGSVSGSCVTCVMEGTRPILSEIQTLAAKTGFGTPRRTASGFDYNRTNLLLAVLEKRAGYFLSGLDVYINVVGGLQMNEPAVDLAVAVSIVSAVTDRPVPKELLAFGEIGLGGEVRAVTNPVSRIYEAERLGFTKCLIPKACLNKIDTKDFKIEIIGITSVREIVKVLNSDDKR